MSPDVVVHQHRHIVPELAYWNLEKHLQRHLVSSCIYTFALFAVPVSPNSLKSLFKPFILNTRLCNRALNMYPVSMYEVIPRLCNRALNMYPVSMYMYEVIRSFNFNFTLKSSFYISFRHQTKCHL